MAARSTSKALIAVVGLWPAIAMADCAPIEGMAAAVRAGVINTVTFKTAEACGTALSETGAVEHHCRWGFDYRAPRAAEQVVDLNGSLTKCLQARPVPQEAGVNHPDTFMQRRYLAEGLAISLSIKDKAALGRSFVFLRMAPAR